MKNKTQFSLLLIGIFFFSCNTGVKKLAVPISNIDTDFPITDKLEFKPFNKYNILNEGGCMIDDSVLWSFESGEHDFGSCYDLNTGEKLSTIASRGKATNEFIDLEYFKIVGDSILLYADKNTIKTFSKKDIIKNTPMGDRKFSVTTAPDSILTSLMTKLPNGSVLATIRPVLYKFEKEKKTIEINQKSVVIFNNKEANSYETIKYESFDIEEAKGREMVANDLIKCAYSNGFVEVKNNNIAVLSVRDQFILYTFDINSGNAINEKRYTEMQRTEEGGEAYVSFETTNEKRLTIRSIKLNDKYILCTVDGYFSVEDKEKKDTKKAIFIFDWDLNPIKKFDLPKRGNVFYTISNDCSSVYSREYNEDGLTLHKADLNI